METQKIETHGITEQTMEKEEENKEAFQRITTSAEADDACCVGVDWHAYAH
jgi:hypothetical protein